MMIIGFLFNQENEKLMATEIM